MGQTDRNLNETKMNELEARHLEIHRIYQRIPLMRRGRRNKLRMRLQKEHDELAPELDDHPVWDGLDGIDDVVLVDFDDKQVIFKCKEGTIAISDDDIPYAVMRFPMSKELPYFERRTYTIYPFLKVEQIGVLNRYSYVIFYKGIRLAVGDRQPDCNPHVIISRRKLRDKHVYIQRSETQTLSIELKFPDWEIVSLGDRAQANGRHFCLGIREGDFRILVDPSIPREKLPKEWQNPNILLVTQVDRDHWLYLDDFDGIPLYSVAAILNQIPYRKKRSIRGPKIGRIAAHPFKTTHKVGVPSIGVRFDFRDGAQVSVIPEFLELGKFAKNLITDTIWIVGVGDYKEDDVKEGKLSYLSLLELADELKPRAIWLTNIRRSLDDKLKGIDKELKEYWNGGVFHKGMKLSSETKEKAKDKDKKVPFWTWAKPAYRIFEVADLQMTPNWDADDRVVLETKCDGLRVQPIVYGDGGVEIWTDPDDIKGPPEEAERSARLPVIVKELSSMGLKGRWRFDGELVAIKEKEALHRTVINSCLTGKFPPEKCANLAHLFIFDVLEAEGKDVRSYPLKERLEILAKLKDTKHIFFSRPSTNLKEKGHFGYVMRVKDITEEWLNQIATQKITDPIEVEKLSEGAMIKKLDAPYEAPHNKSWIKIKKEREIDVLVVDKKEIYRLGKPTGNYNYTIAVGPLTEREAELIRAKGKDKVVEFKGKYWNVLGKTDNTKIDVEVGDIIRIAAEEVIEYETDDPEVKYYSTYIARVLQPVPEREIPDTLEVPRRLAALEPRRVSLVEEKEKKEKYNIKEFIEQGQIPKEIYIKIAKPNQPLPPEFYVDPREGVAWAQTHVRGLEPKDVEKFKQGKLSLADLFVGHSIHCLTGDTEVFVRDGYERVQIRSLRDLVRQRLLPEVLTPEGWRKVTAYIKRGLEKVYRIRLRNGVEIKATADHPHFVYRNHGGNGKHQRWELHVLSTIELQPGDALLFTAGYEGENIGDYDFGRFIGLFIGDGAAYADHLSFTFTNDEHNLAHFVYEYARKLGARCHIFEIKDKKALRVTCFSKGLVQLVRDYVRPDKTFTWRIWRLSRETREGVLNGVWQADGRKFTVSKSIGFHNPRLRDQLCYLAASLGLAYTKRDYYYSPTQWENRIVIALSRDKYNFPKRFLVIDDVLAVKIDAIEELPKPEPVYDLTVEGVPMFTLACGIVTHNCDLRMDLGLSKLVQWVITDNDVESYFKMMLGELRETKGGVMNVAHSLCIVKPSSEPPETEKPKIKKSELEEPSIDKEGAKLLEKYQIIAGSYIIPRGGVGASPYKDAWMGLIWSGKVKTGVARPDYHEYFFYPDPDLPDLNKKLFNGRFIIKCLEDNGDRRWEIWKAVRDPKPADPILHKDTGYHWPLKAEEVPALGKEHYEYGKKEPVK